MKIKIAVLFFLSAISILSLKQLYSKVILTNEIQFKELQFRCQQQEFTDRFGRYDVTVCGSRNSRETVFITPHGQIPPYFKGILSTLEKKSRKVYFIDTGEKLMGNKDSQKRILNHLSSKEKVLCVISQSRGSLPVLNLIAKNSITKNFIGIYPVVDLAGWPDEKLYLEYISFIGNESSSKFKKTYNPLDKKIPILKNLESYYAIGGDQDSIYLQSKKLYSNNQFPYLNSKITLKTLPGLGHEISPEIFGNPMLLSHLEANC
jgi:hypothetical protein